MLIPTLLKIFAAQVVLIALIVFGLKKLLDKILIDVAIDDIKYWQSKEKLAAKIALDEYEPTVSTPDEIIIVSHKPLKPRVQHLIRKEAIKQFGEEITFDFRINKVILGGVIIQAGSVILDHSLKERLSRAFARKS
ncbi:MAG: F0F1 ATP synthase subunit delta [Candidatus Omnitrophica bacterium]|nr:F0F1 ATP synthase subunit delta [Candidatus Omnitrophota bacterium]